MKKYLGFALVFLILLGLCACSRTSVDDASDVTPRYVWGNESLVQKLEDKEAERLARIFDNNRYLVDIPACYFDENISVSFADKVFGVAIDGCSTCMDFSNGEYFNLWIWERMYIESLFGKYGVEFSE